MKLIINASTLSGTGVTQVAVSFIEECRRFTDNTYIVFLSESVASNLDMDKFPPTFSFHIFSGKFYNPVYWKNQHLMTKIETKFKPDCVFSIFGPSWWKPKSPHLQGYAYPHYVYPDSPIWKIMPFKEKLKQFFFKWIHKIALLHSGDFFVCETDDVSCRLASFLNIPINQIYTVSNTANAYFRNFTHIQPQKKDSTEFRFFSMCSPYLHKNLGVLNQVIPILDKYKSNAVFYVTLSNRDYNNLFTPSVRHRIRNAGILKASECPNLVSQCDALFLPTLLECFSASYPEAMIFDKPIITSDLSFAKDICGDAALYFNPLDATNISETILKLTDNESLRQSLVEKGKARLYKFYTSTERAKAYLEICKKISTQQ